MLYLLHHEREELETLSGGDGALELVGGHLGDVAVMQGFILFAALAVLALFWVTRTVHKAAM
jgi:hypothetical protein